MTTHYLPLLFLEFSTLFFHSFRILPALSLSAQGTGKVESEHIPTVECFRITSLQFHYIPDPPLYIEYILYIYIYIYLRVHVASLCNIRQSGCLALFTLYTFFAVSFPNFKLTFCRYFVAIVSAMCVCVCRSLLCMCVLSVAFKLLYKELPN